ncbi:MAG: DUF523 domain-containing protein [Sulfuricurvum sp.]|nr:DUF523 domain-containing protein [Sulfuricurvum sp.]
MKIAVSGCLIGEKIRYDGGDRRNDFITDELGKFVKFVSFCPEHLAFGTPRPSVHLVKEGKTIRVHSDQEGHDLTQALIEKSLCEVARLEAYSLCGIIFKSKSPSCGMKSTKIYLENELCDETVDGVFMAMCRERFPDLPMEEEGRLEDPSLRENFLMKVYEYHRIQTLKTAISDKEFL